MDKNSTFGSQVPAPSRISNLYTISSRENIFKYAYKKQSVPQTFRGEFNHVGGKLGYFHPSALCVNRAREACARIDPTVVNSYLMSTWFVISCAHYIIICYNERLLYKCVVTFQAPSPKKFLMEEHLALINFVKLSTYCTHQQSSSLFHHIPL